MELKEGDLTPLRITLAQCQQTADFDTNTRTIVRCLDDAAKPQAQIVCFPETQTVGDRLDFAQPDTPVEPSRLDDLPHRVARSCRDWNLEFLLRTETPHGSQPAGKPDDSALAIIPNGGILVAHHKNWLTPLNAIADSPGTLSETFVLRGVKVSGVICRERFRFADTTREAAECSTDLSSAEQHHPAERWEDSESSHDDRHTRDREHGLVCVVQHGSRAAPERQLDDRRSQRPPSGSGGVETERTARRGHRPGPRNGSPVQLRRGRLRESALCRHGRTRPVPNPVATKHTPARHANLRSRTVG